MNLKNLENKRRKVFHMTDLVQECFEKVSNLQTDVISTLRLRAIKARDAGEYTNPSFVAGFIKALDMVLDIIDGDNENVTHGMQLLFGEGTTNVTDGLSKENES